MAPLKYPYNWHVTYSSKKHAGIADKSREPYVEKLVFPASSKGQTASALLYEIRKACASPNRIHGGGVFVAKTDRHSGEILDQVRYACRDGKPVRQGARSMKRR